MPIPFECADQITAVLIVRNEVQTIKRALLSVRPFVARTIVVDTGSHDSTPLLCTRLGADVFFAEWQNDFASARNIALSYVRTAWALSLDADEMLDAESMYRSQSLLRSLTDNPLCGGIQVTLHNVLEHGLSASTHTYTRIFRALPAIRYTGTIHEQIRPAIEAVGLTIVESPISIHHYGYADNHPHKIERNRSLLEAELSRHDSAWHRYHLAMTEFSGRNTARAYELFSTLPDHPDLSIEQRELSRLRLAQIALGMNRLSESLTLTNFTSNDVHREGFRRFIRSATLLQEKKYAEVLTLLEHPGIHQSSFVQQEQVDLIRSVAEQLRLADTSR